MAHSPVLKKLTLICSALLVACSTIRTHNPQGAAVDLTEAEFAAYLEHVFRHHNKVVDTLMFTTGRVESSPGENAQLVKAEAKMAHACLPLNETVSDYASGATPDFWTRMRLADAVPNCEAATRKVEELLAPKGESSGGQGMFEHQP